MHSQAFFSLLIAVITLCVAPSIAAPAPSMGRDIALAERGGLYVRALTVTGLCGYKIRPSQLRCPTSAAHTPISIKKLTRRGSGSEADKSKSPSSGFETNSSEQSSESGSDDSKKSKNSKESQKSDPKSQSSGSQFQPGSHKSTTESSGEDDEIECEHAVELQLLSDVGEKSGFCKAMEEFSKISGKPVGGHIEPIARVINSDINLYNIGAQVNAAKNGLTAGFRSNPNKFAKADINNAPKIKLVHEYLSKPFVAHNADNVAKNVDTAMAKAFDEAEKEAMAKDSAKAKTAAAAWTKKPSLTEFFTEYKQYIATAAAKA